MYLMYQLLVDIRNRSLVRMGITTDFGGGKLVQGYRIESWQSQCRNLNSNVG